MSEVDSSNYKSTGNSTFATAVSTYYEQKEEYSQRFAKLLSNTKDEPENSEDKKLGTGTTINMPSHPSDKEGAAEHSKSHGPEASSGSGVKNSAESKKASAMDHKAMPGPVMVDNLPEPRSKEELKREAERINK